MGSCFSQPHNLKQNIKKRPCNPIHDIVQKYSLEKLNERWNRDELKTLQAKVSALVNHTSIDFSRFLQVFPKLINFSERTQKQYYRLFAFQNGQTISKRELVASLTIIKKVGENNHLAPLIFYVYTSDPKHLSMTQGELKLFEQQNKAYAKNIENIQQQILSQLDIAAQLPSPNEIKKQQHGGLPETNDTNRPLAPQIDKTIDLQKFRNIFEHYNLQSYQILFSWNLAQEEKQLVQLLEKEGVKRKKGDKVFLIQYQWFLTWKSYAEQFYKLKIFLQQEGEINLTNYKSATRRKSKQQPRNPHEIRKFQRPGEIKNYLLKYGKKDHQIKENLVEFNNYICVKEQIWSKLVAIYNGGPAIQRTFPKIYYNVVVKVSVQLNGIFISKSSHKIESKQRPTISGYANPQQLSYLGYYKYPGKNNWIKMKHLQMKSQQIFTGPRTYLVFVPKQAQKEFISLYNIRQQKDSKILKERFKNYGTQINFSMDGVLHRGQVVQIEDSDHVTIQFTDQNGLSHRKIIEYDNNFQKFNPKNLSNQSQINQLSGLDNIGNTCYINAVVQCLIRTPFFGNYLENFKFKQKKEKDQQLLIEKISDIYLNSKNNNHSSINMKPFKRAFQRHCPYFEGNQQHDAQQFLLCLLERLMEEIKTQRQQYGVKIQKQQSSNQEDKNMQKKVVKFFSGKTEAVTTCKKCKNKGIRNQSFFTYSISLPEIPYIQFFYIYVPFYRGNSSKSLVPISCGITLGRKATIEQFLDAVKKQKKVKDFKLSLYTVFNNQILNKLQNYSYYKQISYYLHFNAKLVCFQIQQEDTPTFSDYKSKKLADKSVKIQLRQRIYSQKNHQYKVIYQPFILEITHRMYWKDLVEDIKLIIAQISLPKSNVQASQIQKGLGLSEIKVTTNSIKHSISLHDSPQVKNTQSLIRGSRKQGKIKEASKILEQNQDYKIRVVKSDHIFQNNCVFCKQELIANKKSSKNSCKGCSFSSLLPLFDQAQFRNICDNIIIVVDWQSSIPEFQKPIQDKTYSECLQRLQNRKDQLEDLLMKNFSNSQELQLKCEKQSCQYNFANRSQKISIYPNILLLHLKRFTYEDNMLVKLSNTVLYPDLLTVQGEQYQLYGVVSHIGSGVGGHYISFVKVISKWYKCDDSRVTISIQGQHINSNAYLLFYKKVDFEPSLITLNF